MIQSRRTIVAGLVIAALAPVTIIRDAIGQSNSRRVIPVSIKKRKVVMPKTAIRITENDEVVLRWSSDETVKLHLHGYDKELTVHAGKPASMLIIGRATGRFPITSHGWGRGGHGHHALTYLEVHPR